MSHSIYSCEDNFLSLSLLVLKKTRWLATVISNTGKQANSRLFYENNFDL